MGLGGKLRGTSISTSIRNEMRCYSPWEHGLAEKKKKNLIEHWSQARYFGTTSFGIF